MALDLHPAAGVVFFDRRELNLPLCLYGQMVAKGEWRDYSIDGTPHLAVFYVFRRSQDYPLYRFEK